MPVTLITGPHQGGKSRRLWERIRTEPPGSVVLVRPTPGLPHDLVRQVHAWGGPGLLPPVWSFGELVERVAAAAGTAPRVFGDGLAAHALRAWAVEHLRGPWLSLARYRATGRELAELCRRLDDYGITAGDVALAQRTLRERGRVDLVAALDDAWAAHAHLTALAQARGAALPGARLRLLAAADAAPAVATIAFDDFQAFSPAELSLLGSLAAQRTLLITAVDDHRLGGDAAPADRLRSALPAAEEERLRVIAPASPHSPGMRSFLAQALEEGRPFAADVGAAVDRYRYRDPLHAGRAIAAWLRRAAVAPDQALVVVRVADAEALALADALIAAGVPVNGRFQVPFLGTTAGGTLAAVVAWCREPCWQTFLAACERLGGAQPAPLRLADLHGPWSRLSVDEGLARLELLASKGISDGWGWSEPRRERPWLRATTAWLQTWHARLQAEGTWWQRLSTLSTALDLADGGSGVLRALAELAALHPIAPEDCDDLLAAARIEVVRAHGPGAVELTDAIRGRAWSRAVVFIHDLEHSRWPAVSLGGALLPQDERQTLAATLGRDPYDEAARAAGEVGAFLAVAARASARVVLGIPCGEREPCPWLGTICGQLGWDIEALRADAGGEAVPGAPLGPGDAQGAHEQALWTAAPTHPDFTFRVPPTAPDRLGLKVSSLGLLFGDAFAVLCDRLCLQAPLANHELMEEGNELHRHLAELAKQPPGSWPAVLDRLLADWSAQAPDDLTRAERGRFSQRIAQVMAEEAAVAAAASQRAAEVEVAVPLAIPAHPQLLLSGKIDRIDTMADGGVRLVDYKRGAIASHSAALKDGSDGQLLGYLLAARAADWPAHGAYYLSLRSGARAGWGEVPTPGGRAASKAGADLATIDALAAGLGQAIAEFAGGRASADPDGRSARDYAPIARLDEQRLDLGQQGEGEAHE